MTRLEAINIELEKNGIHNSESIISETDKKDALYHIQKVNAIFSKYGYFSCYSYSAEILTDAMRFCECAESRISSLRTFKEDT